MAFQPVSIGQDGTAVIALHRPEVKNAIDLPTLGWLVETLDRVEADSNVLRVVLTGQGDTFCSGGDVKDMVARRGQSVATFERHLDGLAGILERISSSEKIFIARINGDAFGAGFGLVLACDLAVAIDTARFGAVFGKIGLVADTGVSHLLVRHAGLRRANELLLTARVLSATEALGWGLINRVVPLREIDSSVDATIEALKAIPAPTLGRLKRQIARNGRVPISDALHAEAILQGLAFATPEHAERADAFLARKKGGS